MTLRRALAALILVGCCKASSTVAIVPERAADVAPRSPKRGGLALTINSPVLVPRERPAPDPALEPLLDELRKTDVGGASVGYAGQESRFHRAGNVVLRNADRKLVLWLADDEHPTIRALGFAGLAAVGDRDALIRHVCDREWVRVCPGGCICNGETLGSIAQEYLWSPGWLGVGTPDAAAADLLSPQEKESLAFRLAAVDACTLGPSARDELQRVAAKGWSWKAVRGLTLGVPTWMVVKAAARFDNDSSRSLLLEALEDTSSPTRTRLAAASGLTQSTATDAEAALVRHAAFLDGHRKGLGAEFAAVVRMRRRADVLLAKIDAATTWMETEKLASNAVAAYALRHPFIIGRVSTGSFGARDPDVNRARADALLWVSEHLADHAECWSVYRDVAYDLERMLMIDQEWPIHSFAELLGPRLARFEANVRAATARLDADVSCLE